MRIKKSKPLLLCVLLTTITGCAVNKASDTDQVSGTINYKEKVLLSPAAELEVKLLDVSLADAAATELGTTTISNPGPMPIAFVIDYDGSEILPQHTYSVRATVYEHGKMRFTTDTVYPVLTRGADSHVNMMLVPVGNTPRTKTALTETRWALISAYGVDFQAAEGQITPFVQLGNENNTVSGNSGCNNFAGTYTLQDGKLKLGPLAMTMMACIDNDIMQTEQRFAQALSELNRYEITDDRLTGYQDERRILVLQAQNDD